MFEADGEVLGECLADGRREDLVGVGDGRGGFRWRLPFRDPPVDPARIVVRDAVTGEPIADAGGITPFMAPVVGGQVEQRGPDVIAGWAQGPEGPVTVQVRRGEEVLAEIRADGFRPDLLADGIGDGHAAFAWRLPHGDPSFDATAMYVVEARRGVRIPDRPGLVAARRAPVLGAVDVCNHRLVRGWAWDGRPAGRVALEMVSGGEVVGACKADKRRKDLVGSGLDDGRHAFEWTPPRHDEAFDASRLEVVAQPFGLTLPQILRPFSTGLEISDLRVEASWLFGSLRRTGEAEPPTSVDVVIDGRFLLNADIRGLAFDDGGCADLAIDLPRLVNDGRPHRISVHDAREGDLIPGADDGVIHCSSFNSMIEMVTPHEIRGWVIDPDDPDGESWVELYDGEQRLRRVRFGRDRSEVARAQKAPHAWEFVMRRLPLSLFDGELHELKLVCGGRALAPHQTPRIQVRWTEDQSAPDHERFDGAVTEIDATGVKGFVVDLLDDAPVKVEILVDGEVAATVLADGYLAELRTESSRGFQGFDWRFPSNLMNGGRRRVAVRPAGRTMLLPPSTKSIAFPLAALDKSAPPADVAPPAFAAPAPAERAPALLSLIVLNLNGAFVLEPLLRSVAETRFRDRLEIILIDHGSTDATHQIVDAYRGRLQLSPIYRRENYSFSASCNLGAALARGEHLVMLNNDIEFTGDCLAAMRDLLDASPKVGMVGLRLLEPRYRGDGRWEQVTHHAGVGFEAPTPQDKAAPRLYHPVEYSRVPAAAAVVEPAVTAALAMMRKADFKALGGLDEGYRYGYEDIDLALRMHASLGKTAVCLLDSSAVHNRSATREAKFTSAPATPPQTGGKAANLDRFVRRISRHLPRTILKQLVNGGEAWRKAPLRVTFVVGDTRRGADTAAARELGRALREQFGWEPMLIAEDDHDLVVTDVLVSLRPGYDLRKVKNAAPGLVAAAWMWNGPAPWDGRTSLYHLSLGPAGPAEARDALAAFLDGGRRRIAIKAQADNEPRAHALAEALERRGQHVRIDGPRHWQGGMAAGDDLVIAMAGVRAYPPFAGVVNLLCPTPGTEPPPAEAAQAFDHVLEAADPDAAADAALALHDRLRREFLGPLAG
jgi:GT2 family glycosyltransferase